MRTRPVPVALLAVAGACFLLHLFTNGEYGFHRDELATIDDAHYLAWGYVAYPPLTPFLARVALELFGSSPMAIRSFAALAMAGVAFLTGLIARELGGSARAQIVAAVAAMVSPMSMSAGHTFQYVSFDFLWTVLLFYCAVRLLASDDASDKPRWWIAAGAALGLGLMTRYTIAWPAAGLAAGFLLTPARPYLKSAQAAGRGTKGERNSADLAATSASVVREFPNGRWLAAGLGVAFLIVLPNLIWQVNHQFISVGFLRSIHARDVAIGRTSGFLWRQFLVPAHTFTIPLWIAGLYFFFAKPEGARYRVLGWAFCVSLLLFTAVQARDYYTAPLYPMLLAAGAVTADRWKGWANGLQYAGLAAALGLGIALTLPVARAGSGWFQAEVKFNGNLREEIGWKELVERIAAIRDALPPEQRANLGILTGNYGEAGAIDLYGAQYTLPKALSRVNSYWLRGYGDPPPRTLLVVGWSPAAVQENFTSCESRGTISNSLGVANEETEVHKYLWVCQGPREPWPEFWKHIRLWA